MGDINQYANDLLLDFLDGIHECLRSDLMAKFGDEWIERGVARHIAPGYLDKTRKMLESPMRVVDMGKTDEDLYGVEHLADIVKGNWDVFGDRLGSRTRAEVYLGEIAELRHNVSHRRRRHILQRAELLRFVQNARMLLEALASPAASRFAAVVDSLDAGATPWGAPLNSALPPHDEIVQEFVGRPAELRALSEWLATDAPQLVLWGYGGAGKTATAYQFAKDVRDAAPEPLQAICWVSAKREEYVEGLSRQRHADFNDVATFVAAVWKSLYGEGAAATGSVQELMAELRETPTLLVVDDLDTVLADQPLAQVLLFDLRGTKSRVLFTSRQTVPGIPTVEIRGFTGSELERFIKVRAREHELDQTTCIQYAKSIESVTGGFPLFVDDLLRYARIDGIKEALADWSQRKGDAAREYALRRQLSQLGSAASDVLIAICVGGRPVTALECSTVVGRSDEDVAHAVRELERWRLINRIAAAGEGRPGFDANANTRRLVMKTFKGDTRLAGYQAAFTAGADRVPAAKRRAIGSAVEVARSLSLRGDTEAAAEHLKASMVGELVNSTDLLGVLGWVYSRDPERAHVGEARQAFEAAMRHGSNKEDCFYHWAVLERDLAEAISGDDDQLRRDAWSRCAKVAEAGIDRAGKSQALCQVAGYAFSREAKSLEHLKEYTAARVAYGRAAAHFRDALAAPLSEVREVPRGQIYRGLVISLEGLDDDGTLRDALDEWEKDSGGDDYWYREKERLAPRLTRSVGRA